MTAKEILEGNEIIVEFMGGKFVGTERMDGHEYEMYDLPASFPIKLSEPDEFGMKRTGYLGFDTQWDWLMPVVEKINDIYAASTPHIPHFVLNEEIDKVIQLSIRTKINLVLEAVVQFITWYNSQSPSPSKADKQ